MRQELEHGDQRSIWCNRVQSIRPAMEVIARLIARPHEEPSEDPQLDSQVYRIGETTKHTIHNCRYFSDELTFSARLL